MCRKLGNVQMVSQGKYLGLPMVITRSKEQIFGLIRNNCQRRMESWKNKMLSTAGREVLLKAITMALPAYAMSCFKLPGRLCKDISAMMARFWYAEEGRCIGAPGLNLQRTKVEGDWGSGNCRISIKLYLRSKFGDLWHAQIY